tara:strand:+ start:361 stop:567 length:207 start_codon:yes stop_codon:yes gene_type:complete
MSEYLQVTIVLLIVAGVLLVGEQRATPPPVPANPDALFAALYAANRRQSPHTFTIEIAGHLYACYLPE